MTIKITYGDAKIWSADLLISAGAQPSRFILEGDIQGDLDDVAPILRIDDGDTERIFADTRLLSIENRPCRWGDELSSYYVIEDKRWKWWDIFASCDYNRLKCDGDRYNDATCGEIFGDLLTLAGEAIFDVGSASDAIYPVLHYDEQVPVGRMLQDLCELTKHTIGFKEDGSVKVFQLGQGKLPNISAIKSFRQYTNRTINDFKVISKPTLFESLISVNPVGMESTGEIVDLDSVSYKPAAGWSGEWPGQFSGVASASQWLANKSVYRLFEPSSVGNDQTAAAFPLDGLEILENGDCAYNSMRGGVCIDYVIGEFWPEYHRGDVETSATDHWFGDVSVKENIFQFGRPVFKVDDGAVSEPVLKIKAWHRQRDDANGDFIFESLGNGPVREASWVQPVVIHDEGTNLTDVGNQLTEYRRICIQESNIDTSMVVYDGIQSVEVNGNVRSIRHKLNLTASSGGADTEVYIGDGWDGLQV